MGRREFHLLYHIDIAPYLPFNSSGSTFVQFKVPYNTVYNVNVLATPPDPRKQNVTQSFEAYYGKLNYVKTLSCRIQYALHLQLPVDIP